MANGTAQQDPTQAAFDQSAQVPDIPASAKEKGFGLLKGLTVGSGTKQEPSQLEQAIEKHHAQRLDEARMHKKNAATAAGILTYGIDPKTGQPLTDEDKQRYMNEYQAAMGHYEKTAGVNKETKGAIQRARQIVEHMIHRGQQKQQGAAGGPPPVPGGAQSAPGTPPIVPSPNVGPQGSGPPQIPFAEQAPFLREQVASHQADEREFTAFKRQQDVIHKNKMEELEFLSQHPKTSVSGVTRFGPPISVRNARVLAQQGKSYPDSNGEPIDLTSLPDEMGLKLISQGGKFFYEPYSPNEKVITVGNETYTISPMDVDALKQGQGTALGEHTVPSTSRMTDPATGQTTVTTRTPSTKGVSGGPTAPGGPALGAPTPPPPPVPRAGAGGAPRAKSAAPVATGQLDEQGHVPATMGTPQVVEGANQLLDGMDVKSLPAKTKELSANLARKYGWEQGRFTPKEQVMLKESSTFLKEALDNPSMSVLDSTKSKLKLGQVLAASGHQGTIGRTFSTLAASSMTKDEAEFVRMYNQLVGTISGLSQLVRSGRATEAQIERLKAELPNVLTSKDAADGRKRIQRLMKEIDIAKDKGRFGEGEGTPSPGLSDAAKKYLESRGHTVP